MNDQHANQRGSITVQAENSADPGLESIDPTLQEFQPLAVLRQEEHLRDLLLDPEFRPPDPWPGLDPLDPSRLAAEMEAEIRELTAVIEAIDDTVKAADDALIAKREAQENLWRKTVDVARHMEARYRLAELDEVAELLHPLAGRPRSLA